MANHPQKRDEDAAVKGAIPDYGSRAPISQVQLQDVYRYRYHHGTNLGSIFILEKWLFSTMFEESAQGGSELDAVQALVF